VPYNDLREYIARLEREGELITVEEEVDWNLEIGAITQVGIEERGPALLFSTVKGYPGWRVMGNVVGPSRPVIQGKIALAMECPRDTPVERLIEIYRERYRKPVAPRTVMSSPVKQNIWKGAEVDLTRLPVPILHEGDAGRFIGTWHITITQDPDTGWVNWGTYRHQLHGPNTCGWLAHPGQHGPWQYYQKYENRNKPMPIAIAIGCDPICHIMSSSQVPPGLSEAHIAGAMRQAPVDLIKCETNDLMVPASAEIVLEGYVLPNERQMEGGFGEFTGFYASVPESRPVIHIECVTFRDKPIFTVSTPRKAWDDYHVISSVTMSAMLLDDLQTRGIPARAAYVRGPATAIFVSVKPQYVGYIHTVASAVFSSKAGLYRPYLFVCDEDIDITDLEEVYWAMVTRLHPARDIHVFHNTPAMPLMPFLDKEEQLLRRGARVAFDLMFPAEWKGDARPKINDLQHAYPADVQKAALRTWQVALKGGRAKNR